MFTSDSFVIVTSETTLTVDGAQFANPVDMAVNNPILRAKIQVALGVWGQSLRSSTAAAIASARSERDAAIAAAVADKGAGIAAAQSARDTAVAAAVADKSAGIAAAQAERDTAVAAAIAAKTKAEGDLLEHQQLVDGYVTQMRANPDLMAIPAVADAVNDVAVYSDARTRMKLEADVARLQAELAAKQAALGDV